MKYELIYIIGISSFPHTVVLIFHLSFGRFCSCQVIPQAIRSAQHSEVSHDDGMFYGLGLAFISINMYIYIFINTVDGRNPAPPGD